MLIQMCIAGCSLSTLRWSYTFGELFDYPRLLGLMAMRFCEVLRALTFEMAGADLSTHLERGGECDAVIRDLPIQLSANPSLS